VTITDEERQALRNEAAKIGRGDFGSDRDYIAWLEEQLVRARRARIDPHGRDWE
jgi:hypothetical protein